MSDARTPFFDFDVTKMFADFRFRPFDVEAMWAAQRRNIEALSQANQLAVEGAHAVVKRQIEMTQQTFEDLSTLVREMTQPASTEDRIAKHTEYTKKMIDKGLSHGREIAHDGDQGRQRGEPRCCRSARPKASTRCAPSPASRPPKFRPDISPKGRFPTPGSAAFLFAVSLLL
jgi:phasin family protein